MLCNHHHYLFPELFLFFFYCLIDFLFFKEITHLIVIIINITLALVCSSLSFKIWVDSCNHGHKQDTEQFPSPTSLCILEFYIFRIQSSFMCVIQKYFLPASGFSSNKVHILNKLCAKTCTLKSTNHVYRN